MKEQVELLCQITVNKAWIVFRFIQEFWFNGAIASAERLHVHLQNAEVRVTSILTLGRSICLLKNRGKHKLSKPREKPKKKLEWN
jgi:hypothetical protein